jgi:hypothetical protein
MKKIFMLITCTLFVTALFAQDSTVARKRTPVSFANRSNDHLLIQLGYTNWAGAPDSVKTSGLSKSINVYLMYDFPFRTNPKLSMAFGPGISSDHIIFKETYVGIKDLTTTIAFSDKSDTNHFKKTKLGTVYLEAPIELRFMANPANPNKSIKAAIGIKVGTMLSALTRNVELQGREDNTINDYVMKEKSKRFFNKNRLVGMARFGIGHFTLYGSYQLTTLFKDGSGPQVRPFSIGLTLSGL